MPLDGLSTRCLSSELSTALCDARVDRIYQPDRFDIILILRNCNENLRLLMSANPSSPRMHLTTETRENPSLPPMFCMLLRKHLLGSRVISVTSPGHERIIEITFLTQNEIGDKVKKVLIAELMGRHSNIVFLNQERRIHDAIVHVDAAISRVREVMPARLYVNPPDQGKRTIEEAATMIDQLLTNQDNITGNDTLTSTVGFDQQLLAFFPTDLHPKGIEKAILELMGGFSPALCHEIAFLSGLDGRRSLAQLNVEELRLLLLPLRQVIGQVIARQFHPTAFFRKAEDTVPVDFHALSLSDYAYKRSMPSLSAAMDLFYLEKSRHNVLVQKKSSLTKQIGQQLDQARRRQRIHEADLLESQQKDVYRQSGDQILCFIHEIAQGQTVLNISAEQSMDGQPLKIELDPFINPVQNAQRYFKLYAKSRNRAMMSAQFLQSDRSEIDWLESLESALAAAEESTDLAALREELAAVALSTRNGSGSISDSESGKHHGSKNHHSSKPGTVKGLEPGKPGSKKKTGAGNQNRQKAGAKGKSSRGPAPLPPRRYYSSDGLLIQVGRNNLQNDQLTLKQAQKEDIWLHVQKMPGTHVIINSEKKAVPQQTLLEAAETAAYFSRATIASENAKVAVDFCPVSHVRKPAGARPGKVIYDRYQTLMVQAKDPKGLAKSSPEMKTPPEN